MERRKNDSQRWVRASLTVEAALVIPFCLLCLLSFSVLFQMLQKQQAVQLELFKAVQSYAALGTKASTVRSLLQEQIVLRWEDDTSRRVVSAEYSMNIPFIGSRFTGMRRYQQMVFDDYSGVSMAGGEGMEFVYITPRGTVYHVSRECTYLRNLIQEIGVAQVDRYRNSTGAKYYPCEGCCHAVRPEEKRNVYITRYGTRYHSTLQCPKWKRTIRKVRKEQTGTMPACSKCGVEVDE